MATSSSGSSSTSSSGSGDAKRTQKHRPMEIMTELGDDVLLLRKAVVYEELGRAFRIEIEAFTENQTVDFSKIVGTNVTLRVNSQYTKDIRYFNGIVTKFAALSHSKQVSTYHMTLSPWLALLSRSSDCRIFQNKTIPDIIKDVFRENGFADFEDALKESYETREYVVQYRESTFNFVSRLMEEEGIYYYWKHENGKHTLMLSDERGSHEPFPNYAKIPFYEWSNVKRSQEYIWQWHFQQEIQPGQFDVLDYDFDHVSQDMTGKATIDRDHAQAKFQMYDYPVGYTKPSFAAPKSKVRLNEHQSGFETIKAVGDAIGHAVGYLFTINELPWDNWNNKEYLVVSAVHTIEAPAFESAPAGAAPSTSSRSIPASPAAGLRPLPPTPIAATAAPTAAATTAAPAKSGDGRMPYKVEFTAIPVEQTFAPRRTSAKPLISGPQTAFVVGPSGEEIYTDKYGRIRVQFHWDRNPDKKNNEDLSCWMRVAQVWAGKQWGTSFIPRVGHEVVVGFLEGDPDRPIVIGSVYNSANMPPYELPGNKTRTAIKSNSSKGGGGCNEIYFEDKKGDEEFVMQSEKDQHNRVKNDLYEWVGHDSHLIVKNTQTEEIELDRKTYVKGDDVRKVDGSRSLTVKRDESSDITGQYSLKVKDKVSEKFESDHSHIVTGDLYIKAQNIVIEAETNITIKVGDSFIAFDKDTIDMAANQKIEMKSQMDFKISGQASFKAESTGTADLKGSATTVKGDASVTVSGGSIMIG